MKHLLSILLFLSCGFAALQAQNVTSSPLPIVLINVDGNATIPDDYKVSGTMKILYVNDSTTNYLVLQDSAQYIHYQGRIGIEKRGSTSQNLNKRHYGFETRQSDDITNDNVALLGMPAENDWILNPLNYDNSYLRDPLSYALARRTGHYAPRTHYCEVFLGGNYRGIYFLTEKIKADKNRVNVAKIEPTDNTMPKLSGGYITKADKTTGGDPVAWSTPAHNFYDDVNYIHHFPKPDNVTAQQDSYIHACFDSLQSAMDRGDASIHTGYPSIIDIPSFIDYMIIAELASNIDIYQLSTFFHKDRMGKLCAGPVWDFNCAYGNDPFSTPNRSSYSVWQFDNYNNTGSNFWYQLFNNTQFKRLFARRWHELTAPGAPLEYASVTALIDSLNSQISSLVSRDKQRWGYYFSQTSAVNSMKTWLQSRYNWLNSQLTDTLNSLPALPRLAFTKIHYHPRAYMDFSADDQEFIAITNLEDTAVSLAGMYLSQLGISYQFPNAVIDSAQEIYIAADTALFRARYGVGAFGKFSRSLSNQSQRLVLADAWGRTIDDVTYLDEAPWPTAADGSGPFLTLVDPYADNGLGSNWSTDTTLLPIPPCPEPVNLAVSDITYTSAQLSWNSDSAYQWQIEYAFDGAVQTLTATTNTLTLDNLTPGSTYWASIRSYCDETHTSIWSDTIEFSTTPCHTVQQLVVEVQANTALVSWQDTQSYGRWIVSYGPEGCAPAQGTMASSSSCSIQLNDLAPGRYDLYALALCDRSVYSRWSEKTTFEISNASLATLANPLSATISPNPASGRAYITLSGSETAATVSIFDIYGRKLSTQTMLAPTAVLDIEGWPSGIYWVDVCTPQGRTSNKLVIR